MSFTPATALRLPPEGKPRALRAVLAPRIYEGGGPRSGRGSLSAAAGTALSVTAFRRDSSPRGRAKSALRSALNSCLFYSTVPAFARFLRNSRPLVTCIRKIRRKVRIKSRRERIRKSGRGGFCRLLILGGRAERDVVVAALHDGDGGYQRQLGVLLQIGNVGHAHIAHG